MNYPADCVTDEQRWRYLIAFKEYLRLTHNVCGLWFRDGITLDEYTNGVVDSKLNETRGEKVVLPDVLKAQMPYTGKLNQTRWNTFVAWHHRALSIIHTEMQNNLEAAKASRTWPFIWSDLA